MRNDAQIPMFGGRSSEVESGSMGAGFWSSSTWMFRRALMDDFKVRVCAPAMVFKTRTVTNRVDKDGNYLCWVLTHKEGKPSHVRGPDGEFLIKKIPKGGYPTGLIRDYDPKWPEFPSHEFPSFCDKYYVTGDDGTRWRVGSRGNTLPVLRQEILCNPELWPEEKAEILRWIDGDRKLGGDDAEIIRIVDGHFCQRIRCGPKPTVAEIQASGLPEATIENLLYNLRNYEAV